jgi:hypothetical protein
VSGTPEGRRRTTRRLFIISHGSCASGKMPRNMGSVVRNYPRDAVTIHFEQNASIVKKCGIFAREVEFFRMTQS